MIRQMLIDDADHPLRALEVGLDALLGPRDDAEARGDDAGQGSLDHRIADHAQPLVAQRRRLGVRGPQWRAVESAVDVARDGGRFVEREVAVLHHRDLAQRIERRGFARPCRDQLVLNAFLAGGETRRTGERTGRYAVDLDGGHRDVLVQAASRGLSAGSVANTPGPAGISRAPPPQFGAESAIAFTWGMSAQ